MKTPKKFGIGYKLFEQREDGKLFPLFIDAKTETVIGEWVYAKNLPTNGFASRPGWHCSMSTPDAPWLRGYDGSDLGPYKSRFKHGRRMWCEVYYDTTNDYREDALKQPKKCYIDKIPENGYYLFKEGSRGTWVITSAIKVNRILSDEDVKNILDNQNYNMIDAYAPYKASFEKRMKIND